MIRPIPFSHQVNALAIFLILLFYCAVRGDLRYVLSGVIILTIGHIFFHLKTGRWLGQPGERKE